jgi:hypothetical protein
VIGSTIWYRESVVKKEMCEVAIDWVKNAEVNMLKYMFAIAGQNILCHYDTLEIN